MKPNLGKYNAGKNRFVQKKPDVARKCYNKTISSYNYSLDLGTSDINTCLKLSITLAYNLCNGVSVQNWWV